LGIDVTLEADPGPDADANGAAAFEADLEADFAAFSPAGLASATGGAEGDERGIKLFTSTMATLT